ncbi:hypothetical protein ABPG74_022875 [Tetrahymena malaccensis]
MQVNTRIQNPTNYFFNQAPKEAEDYSDKINEFTKKLINTDTCVLCKQDFNFTTHLPRILIHCGHTFCTSCLKNFHKNNRVRCPMCLKLVKQIETIERLPVNHTIFHKLADQYNKKCEQNGEGQIDAQAVLYQQFEASQMIGKQKQQSYQQQPYQYDQQQFVGPDGLPQKMPVRIDEESGLEWCEYHYDRIKHFLCMYHKETCCRVCGELLHAKNECQVMDLYEVEDMHAFLNDFYKKNNFYEQQALNQELMEATLKNNGQNFVAGEGAKPIPGIDPNQLVVGDYSFKEDGDEDEEEGEYEDDDEAEFEDEGDYEDEERN